MLSALIFCITFNFLFSYGQQAQYVSALFKDRPLHPLDEAMYWIEYVLIYKGAHHLKPPSLNLNWFQYLLLDVIFSIIVCLIVIAIGSKYIFDYFFKSKRSPPQKNIKKIKKRN